MSDVASMEDVKICYEQQILKGPLLVFLELIEKGHFPAAQEILPLIKQSLNSFKVPSLEFECDAEAPQIPPDTLKALSDSLSVLSTNVAMVHELVSKLIEQKNDNQPEILENCVEAVGTEA